MAFGDLADISARTGLNPRTARLSNGLSAVDLAAAMLDEWKDWRFGCEAELIGFPNWAAVCASVICGLGEHYANRYTAPGDRTINPDLPDGRFVGPDVLRQPHHYRRDPSGQGSAAEPFWEFYSSLTSRPYSVTDDGSLSQYRPSLLAHNVGGYRAPVTSEVVSPPMTWKDGTFGDYLRFLVISRGMGAGANTSTGGHVHLDAGPLFRGQDASVVLRRLRALINEWYRWEKLIAAAIQVHGNRYPSGYARTAQPALTTCMPNLIVRDEAGAVVRTFGRCIGGNLARESGLNLLHTKRLYEQVEEGKNTIELRIFNGSASPQHWMANVQLGIALCMLAKHAGRPGKTDPIKDPRVESNARYDFHVWLNSLGMTGAEFSTARKYLLQNLPGDAGSKIPRRAHPSAGITGEGDALTDVFGRNGRSSLDASQAQIQATEELGYWAKSADGFMHTYAANAAQGINGPFVTVQELEGRFLPMVVLGHTDPAKPRVFFVYPSGFASDSLPLVRLAPPARFSSADSAKAMARLQKLFRQGPAAIGINIPLWSQGFANLDDAKRAGLGAMNRVAPRTGALPPRWTGPVTAPELEAPSGQTVADAAPMGAGRRGRAAAASAAARRAAASRRARGSRTALPDCRTAQD